MNDKNQPKKVLFICRNNSGRSQMAEAILRHLYGSNYKVNSAGSEPRTINPLTIEVLKEIGIDASQQESKSLEKFQDQEFDLVVTLCDSKKQACPLFLTGKRVIHQGFEDPTSFDGKKKGKLEYFREIRDDVYQWIEKEFQTI